MRDNGNTPVEQPVDEWQVGMMMSTFSNLSAIIHIHSLATFAFAYVRVHIFNDLKSEIGTNEQYDDLYQKLVEGGFCT